MIVGSPNDDEGGFNAGALYLLYLQPDGSLKNYSKIVNDINAQGKNTSGVDRYGNSLTTIGNLDGDGINEIAVGTNQDTYVEILFFDNKGDIKNQVVVSPSIGGFAETLPVDSRFGNEVVGIGDINSDMIPDLAVGDWLQSNGGSSNGAVYIIFLNTDGTVQSFQEISAVAGGIDPTLVHSNSQFGLSITSIDDLDNDGRNEIVVGLPRQDKAAVLYLNQDGTVKNTQILTPSNISTAQVTFGTSLSTIDDRDGDGIREFIGTYSFNSSAGSFITPLVMYLNQDGTLKNQERITKNNSGGYFEKNSIEQEKFGFSATVVNDFNENGKSEIMYGAYDSSEGNTSDSGAVYTLFEGSKNIFDFTGSIFGDDNANGIRDIDERRYYVDAIYFFKDDGDGIYEYSERGVEATDGDEQLFSFRVNGDGEFGQSELDSGGYWLVLEAWYGELTNVSSTTHPTNPIYLDLQSDTHMDIGFAPATSIGNNVNFDTNNNGVYDQTFNDTGNLIPELSNAGNASTSYTLPFNFPFYGIEYSQIEINLDGQIRFQELLAPGTFDLCGDRYTAINPTDDYYGPFIAPLWQDQSTNTVDDPNVDLEVIEQGVYITEKVDSIVIRWQTYRENDYHTPLKYEVELFKNGNIELHYGDFLNEPLPDNAGYWRDQPNDPVIGINNGTPNGIEGIDYQTLQYSNYLGQHELRMGNLPGLKLTYNEEDGTYTEDVLDDKGAKGVTLHLHKDNGDGEFDINNDEFKSETTTDEYGKYLLEAFETGNYWVSIAPEDSYYNPESLNTSPQWVEVDSLGKHLLNIDFLISIDSDGVSDDLENAAPNSGDGNNDGIKDSLQTDVSSFPLVTGEYITLDANGCKLSNISIVEESILAAQDEYYDYPYGFVDFTGECSQSEIVIYFYPEKAGVLRKFNNGFTSIEGSRRTDIVINSQNVFKYEYTVSDGGLLDTGPSGDGLIEDPFGFGVPKEDNTPEIEITEPTASTLIRTGGRN